MKKFISMVMAAAMVVSLVPATAFAAGEVTATAKVMDAIEMTSKTAVEKDGIINEAKFPNEVPEVQLTITGADYRETEAKSSSVEVTYTLDGAKFIADTKGEFKELIDVLDKAKSEGGKSIVAGYEEGKEPVAAHYKNVVADAAGEYFVKAADIKADKTAADSAVVKFPTFTTIPEKDGVDVLKAEGYELVTLLDAKEYYVLYNENGTIAKKVLNDPAATNAFDVPEKSVAAQRVEFYNKMIADGYTRVAATPVAADPGTAKGHITVDVVDFDDDYVTYKFTGAFVKDNVIAFDVESTLKYTSEGKVATVSVDSDLVDMDATPYVTIAGKALKASVKKVAEVAEEEVARINDKGLKIGAVVGNLPNEVTEDLTIKISKGFEFTKKGNDGLFGDNYTVAYEDEDELTVDVTGNVSEIIIKNIEIAADTAKAGDVATLTIYADGYAKATVEVMTVIDYTVIMSVDEDADVPTFYNGTNVLNKGLTVKDDHMSLEVTIAETFRGAWDMDKSWTLSLPEGVFVTKVEVTGEEGAITDSYDVFKDAYVKGEHVDFEFAKRVYNETDPDWEFAYPTVDDGKENKVSFKLEMVAAPTFVGDVVLKLEGAAVDTQEVTIAKVLAPYTVKAEQNDVIIDYRFTSVDTDIVVTEAEAGLWEEDLKFTLDVEKEKYIEFEDKATFTVNAESDMELTCDTLDGKMTFEVDEESEEVAAEVVINGIELFMQRNIPAGPYALELTNTAEDAFDAMPLFGQDAYYCAHGTKADDCNDVSDVFEYSDVVKEGWINVVTAGRDKDDASFTTKVIVPVGESYLVAGDKQYTLDVPAYINAAGYTMMPVRAVAVALGIDNDAVQWDNDTKTVIIMYGQRVITMTAGQKVVYASGTAIPAKSAVEIVDGRAFLGLRDLATALGVTAIDYDAATKTATLN